MEFMDNIKNKLFSKKNKIKNKLNNKKNWFFMLMSNEPLVYFKEQFFFKVYN